MQNGQVAAELADVAMEAGNYDTALKALRAVTLMKSPGPMSRALAFLRQGQIANAQGDPKKAVFISLLCRLSCSTNWHKPSKASIWPRWMRQLMR
jgi:hypothetical protein